MLKIFEKKKKEQFDKNNLINDYWYVYNVITSIDSSIQINAGFRLINLYVKRYIRFRDDENFSMKELIKRKNSLLDLINRITNELE